MERRWTRSAPVRGRGSPPRSGFPLRPARRCDQLPRSARGRTSYAIGWRRPPGRGTFGFRTSSSGAGADRMQKAWRLVEAALCCGGILVRHLCRGPALHRRCLRSLPVPPLVFIPAASGSAVTKPREPMPAASIRTASNPGGFASASPSPEQAALAPYPGAVSLTPAPYVGAPSPGATRGLCPQVSGCPPHRVNLTHRHQPASPPVAPHGHCLARPRNAAFRPLSYC